MFKKTLILALSIFALSACTEQSGTSGSVSKAPTEDQAKQALYEKYKTGDTSRDNEMKKTLQEDISIKSCKAEQNGYLCAATNKASKNKPEDNLFFVFDKTTEKWKNEKLDSFKN